MKKKIIFEIELENDDNDGRQMKSIESISTKIVSSINDTVRKKVCRYNLWKSTSTNFKINMKME